MNIKELRKEYENAGYGWFRAAFGSIIRRNYDEIKKMTPHNRKLLIKEIGAPATYTTELSKELKSVEYDQLRKGSKF